MNQEHPTVKLLQEKFGSQHCQVTEYAGMVTVLAAKSILLEIMRFLHDDEQCCYEQLTDVIGIDYLGYPQETMRFALVYPLLSLRHNRRLVVKVLLDESDMAVPSLTGIYRGAEWPEREAAEMFGYQLTVAKNRLYTFGIRFIY